MLLTPSNKSNVSGAKNTSILKKHEIKLSEGILMQPACLSEGNTKLILNGRSIAEIDLIDSVKLQALLIINLNNNNIKSIA
jgi:hypothetical protein